MVGLLALQFAKVVVGEQQLPGHGIGGVYDAVAGHQCAIHQEKLTLIFDNAEIGVALVQAGGQEGGHLRIAALVQCGGTCEGLQVVEQVHETHALGEGGLDLGHVDGHALPGLLKIVMPSAGALDAVAQAQVAAQRRHQRLHFQNGCLDLGRAGIRGQLQAHFLVFALHRLQRQGSGHISLLLGKGVEGEEQK